MIQTLSRQDPSRRISFQFISHVYEREPLINNVMQLVLIFRGMSIYNIEQHLW